MHGLGTITGANLFVYNYAPNTGNSIYAVVLNSAGTIIAQSAPAVIALGDLGTYKSFTFPTPPAVTDADFFVGLAQPTGGTAQWYPMGCMVEAPYRADTYYSFGITGGAPAVMGVDYKFMIEAIVLPPPGVPTLSEWALILLGVLLVGVGAFYIVRRRQTSMGI